MAVYCTLAEVLDVARQFKSINQDDIESSVIDTYIAEATEFVKHLLLPQFDLATIEASVPKAVNYCTKYIAAKFSIERYFNAGADEDEAQLKSLHKEISFWKSMISKGLILDSTDTPLPADFDVITSSAIVGDRDVIDDLFSDKGVT